MTYFIKFMDTGKILLRCNELSEAALLSNVEEIPEQINKFIARIEANNQAIKDADAKKAEDRKKLQEHYNNQAKIAEEAKIAERAKKK